MGRTAEAWKLKWPSGAAGVGVAYVRFRHEKHRYDLSTGERDPGRAKARAAQIYAEVISGRRRPVDAPAGPLAPLDEVVALWLEDIESTHGKNTCKTYKIYAKAHWIPHFVRMDRMNGARLADYGRDRLRKVLRDTVQKELGALRNFLAWCEEQGVLAKAPVVPPLPPKSTGKRSANRKSRATDLTPEEVSAWLAAMPEWSIGRKNGARRFAVRPRFVVAWETGLRPSTLDKISVPEHYRKGALVLVITDEIDKARFGRELPLTEAARAALDLVCSAKGLVFGHHDYRSFTRSAATRAGIDPAKVETISPYDLRHARTLHLTEQSGNLPGVAYLVGHTRLTTTNKYLRGTERAAKKVLDAVAPEKPIGCDSGAAPTAESAKMSEEKIESASEQDLVRRRGLEPLRCYPLAPQRSVIGLRSRYHVGLDLQSTPGSAEALQPSGVLHPNSEASETLLELARYVEVGPVLWDLYDVDVADSDVQDRVTLIRRSLAASTFRAKAHAWLSRAA